MVVFSVILQVLQIPHFEEFQEIPLSLGIGLIVCCVYFEAGKESIHVAIWLAM